MILSNSDNMKSDIQRRAEEDADIVDAHTKQQRKLIPAAELAHGISYSRIMETRWVISLKLVSFNFRLI